MEGNGVKFECKVEDFNETAIWYKDDAELTSSESRLLTSSGQRHCLEIYSVDPRDAGTYKVKIKNSTRNAVLRVKGTH